ncbi:MAG TPA: tetratricopeptide repeat protein [Acidobacteria bacterium]|nr:tetratricopeptide repeat protein [Acidobacteriota bacterium]
MSGTIARVCCLVLVFAAAGWAVQEVPYTGSLPPGTSAYVEAGLAEAAGKYRTALEEYQKALNEDPSSAEVRIAYAALLNNVGLSERALAVLKPLEPDELDWYGIRTKALALAQAAARDPLKLPAAEAALRKALAGRSSDPNVELALVQVLEHEKKLEEAEKVMADLLAARPGNPRLIAYEAGLLRRLGRLDEAATMYGRCAQYDETAEACRQAQADILEAAGRPLEAADAILSWAGPKDFDLKLRAASLYLDANHPGKALAIVRRVLAAEPDSPRAGRLEAAALMSLGRYDEALARLRALHQADPDDAGLALSLAWLEARLGQIPQARKTVARVWKKAKADPRSDLAVRSVLTGARVELVAGRTAAARQWLARLPDPQLGGRELVALLAETYRKEQDWDGGIGAMLRLGPQLDDGARDDAVAYEAEFRLRANQPGAEARLRPLLASKDVDTVHLALDVLQATGRWDAIVDAAPRILERFPGDRHVLFVQAAALERLGRRQESEKVFQKILALDPDDAEAANYLGYMWADAGEHLDEALHLIKHAVELKPGTGAYLDSLGWVYFKLGKLDEAERWLRRAMKAGESSGTVHAHLGEVLLALGRKDEAKRQLERGLDLGCEHEDHVRKLLDGLEKTAPPR